MIKTRRCNDCGGEYPATKEYFTVTSYCRSCWSERYKKWYRKNREYAIERAKESTRKRRERPEVREQERIASRERKRIQLADPVEREKHNARQRQWYKDNPGAHRNFKHHQPHMRRMYAMQRYAAELQATPLWLSKEDRDKIECIYIIADFLTQRTGVKYDVDHVHPLRGLTCCGLHVPWNMRVITAAANQSKGNRLLEGA